MSDDRGSPANRDPSFLYADVDSFALTRHPEHRSNDDNLIVARVDNERVPHGIMRGLDIDATGFEYDADVFASERRDPCVRTRGDAKT